MSFTQLQTLYYSFGQSPWLDALSRDMIESGELKRYIDSGIRGVTSNPSIFEKAILGSDSYDSTYQYLRREGHDVEAAFVRLARQDIQTTADMLLPLYKRTVGRDGYVSMEVSPRFAHDTEKTVEQARWLWDTIERPNLMIKVPATRAGLPAIEQLTREGINVNVTLVFGLHRYLEVMHAYLKGLETRDGKLDHIHSVASFFVSRVDTLIDEKLKELHKPTASRLRGHIANAQAYVAYEMFLETFCESKRWNELKMRGANIQRPLWASTSTKNPSYPDLLYISNLVVENTINTMTPESIGALEDHGNLLQVAVTPERIKHAHAVLNHIKDLGIDMTDVSHQLEKEGVEKFEKAYDAILAALAAKD